MIASGRTQVSGREWEMLLVQNQLNHEMQKYHSRSVSWTFLLRGAFKFNSQDRSARELVEAGEIKILIFSIQYL